MKRIKEKEERMKYFKEGKKSEYRSVGEREREIERDSKEEKCVKERDSREEKCVIERQQTGNCVKERKREA